MDKYYLMPCARQNQKSFGCKVAFCVNNGLEPITKKAWNAMPRLKD